MFTEGCYVCIKAAPETGKGTLHHAVDHLGESQLLFRHDPRFKDTMPDSFVMEDEVEECKRPSDADVERVNKLISYSG